MNPWVRSLAVICVFSFGQGCSDDDVSSIPDQGSADAAIDIAVGDAALDSAPQPDVTPPTPDGPSVDVQGQLDVAITPDKGAPKPDAATTPDSAPPKPDQGSAACPPKCDKIGSKSEGWYTCAGGLITWANCKGCTAQCDKIGSKSEGWYSSCDKSLIKWDQCGQKP